MYRNAVLKWWNANFEAVERQLVVLERVPANQTTSRQICPLLGGFCSLQVTVNETLYRAYHC